MKNPPVFKVKQRAVFVWHRRAGVLAALFILLLAVSGLLLNHSPALGLDKQPLQSNFLLDWYGVAPPHKPSSFNAADVVISQLDDQLFIDGRPLWQTTQPLLGVAANDMLIVLAFEHELLLFTFEGELVERISDLPAGLAAISAIGNDTYGNISLRHNQQIVIADKELIDWHEATENSILHWSQPLSGTSAYDETIQANFRPLDLTYERLLLDLHSGRLLGDWGPYLMDGAAAAMILLALSGLWRWRKSRP
jgi:hypothetical protein